MIPQDFDHLQGETTTVARCLALHRSDGVVLGFTDHDRPLDFDGIAFRPEAGMNLSAFAFGTGLAVDDGEMLGVLASAALTEADIRAGRWDGAGVHLWLVDWTLPARRTPWFRGTLGEITREGGAFRAELRSRAEALNRTTGRVYQARCAAVLGDAACGVALAGFTDAAVVVASEGRRLQVDGAGAAASGWYAEGLLRITSGAAAGLVAAIRSDRALDGGRALDLWQGVDALLAPGDSVALVAGCDKYPETCRVKFGNLTNYRGFPHVPGEDWQLAVPARSAQRDGGALRR